MKIALVSDVHLGNHRRFGGPVESGLNRRCRETLVVLDKAAERAVADECDALVVAGDLFDSTRPEPQIIAAGQRVLDQNPKITTLIIRGNHDMVSEQEGDHTLGALEPVAYVFEKPARFTVGDGELLLVPFQTGVASEWLPLALSSVAEGQGRVKRSPSPASRVLVLHLGLIDGDTPPWLKDAQDAVPVGLVQALCRKYDIDACFAGNWHEHKVWKDVPFVCQIGALVPTGFDNPGLKGYGTLAVWDSKTGFKRIEIPGPRFLKQPDEIKVASARKVGHQVYVQFIVDDADARAARQRTLDEGMHTGEFAGGEVVQDDTEAKIDARTAAMAARSAKTMQESLVAFVREMPLDETVDRAQVLERSKKYLGGFG